MKVTSLLWVVLAVSVTSAQERPAALVYHNGTETRCTVLQTSDDSILVRFGDASLTRWVQRTSLKRVTDPAGRDITSDLFQPHVSFEQSIVPRYRTEVVLSNGVVLRCNVVDSTGGTWTLAMEQGERKVSRGAVVTVRDLAYSQSVSVPSSAVDARGDIRGPLRKDPALAGVLSFVMVGLGQVYNGEAGKGLVLLTATGGCYYAYWASVADGKPQGAWVFVGLGLHLISIVDAISVAPRVGADPGVSLTLRLPVREP